MRHLRCLCFVRPSSDTIQLLIDEFRDPKYGEYNICTFGFSASDAGVLIGDVWWGVGRL